MIKNKIRWKEIKYKEILQKKNIRFPEKEIIKSLKKSNLRKNEESNQFLFEYFYFINRDKEYIWNQ